MERDTATLGDVFKNLGGVYDRFSKVTKVEVGVKMLVAFEVRKHHQTFLELPLNISSLHLIVSMLQKRWAKMD